MNLSRLVYDQIIIYSLKMRQERKKDSQAIRGQTTMLIA